MRTDANTGYVSAFNVYTGKMVTQWKRDYGQR